MMRHSRRSFTLIEIIVAISLIIVLASILLTVGVAVVANSEGKVTETTLTLLQSASREYSVMKDRDLTYGTPDDPFTGAQYELVQTDFIDENSVEVRQLLHDYYRIMFRASSVKEILTKIEPEYVQRDDATADVEVIDVWDKRILVVLPGREWTTTGNSYPRDIDNTIQTRLELRLGSCPNRQSFFVSAGPDGDFGDVSAAFDTSEYQLAQDNLYSQRPLIPTP